MAPLAPRCGLSRPPGRGVMDLGASIQKLRAASCSVLLLLLTLALVACSLLVARYAVQASSWWLSLLAVTVCLLGLCTWIQLAASRAGRWRVLLARQMALSRAHAAAQGAQGAHNTARVFPGLDDLYAHAHAQAGRGQRSDSTSMEYARIAVISLNLDQQPSQRLQGPPPPPPYALSDLPPSYGAVTVTSRADGRSNLGAEVPATAAEPPPPYSVAIKRDDVVQESSTDPPTEEDLVDQDRGNNSHRSRDNNVANRRPVLWY